MAKKVAIMAEYSDFIDVLSKKLVADFCKCFNINKYAIDLEIGKQLLYEPTYSLKPVE